MSSVNHINNPEEPRYVKTATVGSLLLIGTIYFGTKSYMGGQTWDENKPSISNQATDICETEKPWLITECINGTVTKVTECFPDETFPDDEMAFGSQNFR